MEVESVGKMNAENFLETCFKRNVRDGAKIQIRHRTERKKNVGGGGSVVYVLFG